MLLAIFASVFAAVGADWNPMLDHDVVPAARMPSPGAPVFRSAVPVWPEGRSNETNSFFGFRADFSWDGDSSPVLKISAASFYRVYVNGEFVGHGPVRAPHGYSRMDEWPLDTVVRKGSNAVAVEVSNYKIKTYNCIGTQSGFLWCEVAQDNRVLCATGSDFTWFDLPRVRNTSRITPQRAFVEMYRHKPGWDAWRTGGKKGELPKLVPELKLLPRLTPYPSFDIVRPIAYETTCFTFDVERPAKRPELVFDGLDELGRIDGVSTQDSAYTEGRVALGEGFLADFGRVDSGFIGFEVVCEGPCTVYAAFDELLTDGIPNSARRYGHDTMTVWELESGGRYVCEMFEPTAVRYLHLFARKGEARVSHVYLREYKNPRVFSAEFECSDSRVNRVFAAARETCSQCTMDSTLDNSSRERNSGPCDAFFTLGAYSVLSGGYEMERLFFENYAIPSKYPGVDSVMLPWCYPAESSDAELSVIPPYIPWFLIQLERYTRESGDTSIRDRMRERLLKIPAFMRRHMDSDGLIGKMGNWWMFMDWSTAGCFTQDVSYPMNMIWPAGLDVLARMYDQPDLHREAECLRATVRKQSYDGRWFHDHAVRETDGRIVVLQDVSEFCQYYALHFQTVTKEQDADFWDRSIRLLGRLSPGYGKCLGRMYPANYFQGLMLRHKILSEAGLDRQLVREVGYLIDMADSTGTLWESYPGISLGHVGENALYSCCQGFGSYAAVLILRSALGVKKIDRQNRIMTLRVPDNGLEFCSALLPTAEGPARYSWRREGGSVRERVELPPGWCRD